ncbi:hypothetical protein [Patulibacter minatonensis]|uniref:hypothetical protein n=1 Tax=Patulibacter minatonensis TaxID=298163 RepID=UPI00055F07D3|nr:hypothetical protein [Patulibacter minatonensis]
MRGSRSLSLSLVLCCSAALAGCGGGDDDRTRLSRGEFDVLVRQHREAVELTKDDPETAADVQRYVSTARKQCKELEAAGPVLRTTAPACRSAADALDAFATFGEDAEACGEEDVACLDEAVEGLVTGSDRVVRAYDESAKAIDGIEASERCRAALRGPEEDRDALAAVRDAGRELLTAQKKATAGGDATGDRVEAAAKRFEAAAGALERLDTDLEASDPAPCEADVEKS